MAYSETFREETDLDLPDFNPTKYNPILWKVIHSLFYSIFSFAFLGSSIMAFSKKQDIFIKFKIITDVAFLAANSMIWFHYKRGCIGNSNLNSDLKTNIDKSFKAKLLRSKSGWKHFFGLISSFILIYGDIYYLLFCEKSNPDFWNINLIGMMLLSLSQILKIDKILTENNQYLVKNDISNCMIEIFLFFGSLFLGNSYFLSMAYYQIKDTLRTMNIFLKLIGNIFIIFSDIALIYRYFFSGYDDLNTSINSNITV